MDKKVVVFIGSPVVGGNTEFLADAFIKGAEAGNNDVDRIHLGVTKIRPCQHCDQCFIRGAPCIQEDAMGEIYELIQEADTLVFASPVYFYTFSSQLKALIDRLYAFGFSEGFRLPAKECILLASAYNDEYETFRLMSELYERIFVRFLNWRDRGRVFSGGLSAVCIGQEDKTAAEVAFNLGKSI